MCENKTNELFVYDQNNYQIIMCKLVVTLFWFQTIHTRVPIMLQVWLFPT